MISRIFFAVILCIAIALTSGAPSPQFQSGLRYDVPSHSKTRPVLNQAGPLYPTQYPGQFAVTESNPYYVE